MSQALRNRKILVVEDEYFIVQELVASLRQSGAEIVGMAATVDNALGLIADTATIDGAILDINLQGQMSYPVADALAERGVPVIFATGYDAEAIPVKYKAVALCEKPVDPEKVGRALFR